MTRLSRLISARYSGNLRDENSGCSCEACGRAFENAVKLTNLSVVPQQTYNACPFCFSRLEEIALEEAANIETLAVERSISTEQTQESSETPEHIKCPHHLGYLKKRPKDAPIPDACLTCQKMIQCLF